MSVSKARATRARVQPRSVTGVLNPNPGREGTTTWKASSARPPCATGSTSGPIMSRKSVTVARVGVHEQQRHRTRMRGPGVQGSGSAGPSMVVTWFGWVLSLASTSRQSKCFQTSRASANQGVRGAVGPVVARCRRGQPGAQEALVQVLEVGLGHVDPEGFDVAHSDRGR
jgi:hypothetical protein